MLFLINSSTGCCERMSTSSRYISIYFYWKLQINFVSILIILMFFFRFASKYSQIFRIFTSIIKNSTKTNETSKQKNEKIPVESSEQSYRMRANVEKNSPLRKKICSSITKKICKDIIASLCLSNSKSINFVQKRKEEKKYRIVFAYCILFSTYLFVE